MESMIDTRIYSLKIFVHLSLNWYFSVHPKGDGALTGKKESDTLEIEQTFYKRNEIPGMKKPTAKGCRLVAIDQ